VCCLLNPAMNSRAIQLSPTQAPTPVSSPSDESDPKFVIDGRKLTDARKQTGSLQLLQSLWKYFCPLFAVAFVAVLVSFLVLLTSKYCLEEGVVSRDFVEQRSSGGQKLNIYKKVLEKDSMDLELLGVPRRCSFTLTEALYLFRESKETALPMMVAVVGMPIATLSALMGMASLLVQGQPAWTPETRFVSVFLVLLAGSVVLIPATLSYLGELTKKLKDEL